MKLFAAAFTRQGAQVGKQLQTALQQQGDQVQLYVPARLAQETDLPAMEEGLAGWTAHAFEEGDGLLFVGAVGIAVRAIAPHVRDKRMDPAVVAVDELGNFAVPLLAGHIGGANRLAQRVAAVTGGQPVISTATDLHSLWAVDVFATQNQCAIGNMALAKEISASLLEGKPVAFASDWPVEGQIPPELCRKAPLGVHVTYCQESSLFERTLCLHPRRLVVGIGCRKGTPEQAIAAVVEQCLARQQWSTQCLRAVATIDLKAEEPGLLAFCQSRQLPLRVYTSQQLAQVPGQFTPSAFVRGVTGVDNVCERSAAAAGGRLLVQKQALSGVTVALAEEELEHGLAY
ncbi:MAG: cobalt-precorrin 5A hydrolase [Eubacteriales bacterium]|jgi:cobalt-precorrin 5A hydrolase